VTRLHVTPQKAPLYGAFLFWALICPAIVSSPSATGRELPGGPAVQVAYVIDGDTIALRDRRHVRLIGINAPELGHPCRDAPTRATTPGCRPTTDEPLAQEARHLLQSLVDSQAVTLVPDTETQDHYGRTLAYLRLADGSDPGERLLERGLASAIAVPPNLQRLARYQAIETQARQARRGLWDLPYYAAVPADRLPADATGYRWVRGRVSRIGRSQKYVYLDLGPRLSLRVARDDWERYFSYAPDSLLHREIEARGWISAHDGKQHLRVQHAAMLTRLPEAPPW
jgi:endonuclease YncB( thermonuclease family)